MTLVLIVVFVALVSEYINAFHDTANSIAMGVSTRALTPRAALTMASIRNLVGALVGTAVANTISKGLLLDGVIPKSLTSYLVISALLGAIIWNLLTGGSASRPLPAMHSSSESSEPPSLQATATSARSSGSRREKSTGMPPVAS